METDSKRSVKKTIFIILGIVVALLVVVYVGGAIYFSGHFLPNTYIDNVNFSGKAKSTASQELKTALEDFSIRLSERNDKREYINSKDFSVKVTVDEDTDFTKLQSGAATWFMNISERKEYNPDYDVTYDEAELEAAVDVLDFMNASNMVKPTDAVISYDKTSKSYIVTDGDPGTTVDESVIYDIVGGAVTKHSEDVDLSEEGAYVRADYVSGDAAVTDALNTANSYVKSQISYNYGDETFTFDSDTISEWINISDDMKVTIDKSKVNDAVTAMAKQYNTIYTTRTFHTSYDYDIDISSGDYGWWIDVDSEVKEVLKLVKSGQETTGREPVYLQKAAARGEDDLGGTYVEVNLSRQHAFLYQDGEMIAESDCVSGKNVTCTPSGIFSITYKDHAYDDHEVTFVGETYTSQVNFFIPFYGNVGLHDAPWRKAFGGTIYKTNGSHGCVNLPYDFASKVYDVVEKGEPVIVYSDPDNPAYDENATMDPVYDGG